MLIAGLTGGLACGKSFVAEAFRQFGCHVIEADELGHAVMLRGGECYDAIVSAFGRGVLNSAGEIDRAQLAKRVFADPDELRRVNAIVHPAVRLRSQAVFEQLAVSDPNGVGIYVAAILLETGLARDFSKLIVVNCTREQQMQRSLARGASEADVLARLERQLPLEKKLALADYVIDAAGAKEETLRQTRMVYEKLRELAL